jgi:hypothetical protein
MATALQSGSDVRQQRGCAGRGVAPTQGGICCGSGGGHAISSMGVSPRWCQSQKIPRSPPQNIDVFVWKARQRNALLLRHKASTWQSLRRAAQDLRDRASHAIWGRDVLILVPQGRPHEREIPVASAYSFLDRIAYMGHQSLACFTRALELL